MTWPSEADPVSEGPDAATRARYVAIITDGNGRWAQRQGVSVEDGHRAEAELQKLTDQHTSAIDAALAAKEKEILEV